MSRAVRWTVASVLLAVVLALDITAFNFCWMLYKLVRAVS